MAKAATDSLISGSMPTSLHVRALRPIADGNQSCRRTVPGSQSAGVEADVRNAGPVGQAAAGQGLFQVEVRQADASLAASFADALPADVLLLCGIFGNVNDRDIRRTVQAALALCGAGATVIWTRHRRPPDLTPQIRAWFAESGFDEVAFDALETSVLTSVGVNRLCGAPADTPPSHRRFTFPRCMTEQSGRWVQG
jgi:hypothetical protein